MLGKNNVHYTLKQIKKNIKSIKLLEGINWSNNNKIIM